MKEQLFLSGPTPPPLWKSTKHSALLMNIRTKNNTVTRIGHYLHSVLARCANCQRRRHLSEHCESQKKKNHRQVWTNQLKLIFPAAYVNSGNIFTGNSAGVQRRGGRCLYKAKTEVKSQESILNTFALRQNLYYLQSKIKCTSSLRGSAFSQRWITQLIQVFCTCYSAKAPQVLVSLVLFNAEYLFVCLDDIMLNQMVFQILTTQLFTTFYG